MTDKPEFKREASYIVVKRSHLDPGQETRLMAFLDGVLGITPISSVVVEHDWPEYEPVWQMLEARVTGADPVPPAGDWAIDTTAGRPILVYQGCSVIEAEQAYYVLGLINGTVPPAGGEPDVYGFWCAPKGKPNLGVFHRLTHMTGDEYPDSFRQVTDITALVDRAHVTRLQAEVERLKQVAIDRKNEQTKLCAERNDLQAEVERLKSMSTDPFDRMRDLQSELTKLGDDYCKRVDELTKARELLDAKQKLTDEDLIGIARNAALNSVHRYNYMPCIPEDAYKWEPHYWVVEAMRAVRDHQSAPAAKGSLQGGWVTISKDVKTFPDFMRTDKGQGVPVVIPMGGYDFVDASQKMCNCNRPECK